MSLRSRNVKICCNLCKSWQRAEKCMCSCNSIVCNPSAWFFLLSFTIWCNSVNMNTTTWYTVTFMHPLHRLNVRVTVNTNTPCWRCDLIVFFYLHAPNIFLALSLLSLCQPRASLSLFGLRPKWYASVCLRSGTGAPNAARGSPAELPWWITWATAGSTPTTARRNPRPELASYCCKSPTDTTRRNDTTHKHTHTHTHTHEVIHTKYNHTHLHKWWSFP